MKFSIYMISILIIVGGFQYIRSSEMGDYYSLSQEYDFNLPEGRDGEQIIDNPQTYLILHDNQEDEVFKNFKLVLEFTKGRYDIKNILDSSNDLDKYSCIIIIASSYRGMNRNTFQNLKNYVLNGGNILFLKTPYSSPFNSMQGIVSINEYINTQGFVFKKPFFPGLDKVNPGADILPGSSLNVDLSATARVIATDEQSIPLIWENTFGIGRVVTTNTTLLTGKITRGILTQLLAYSNNIHIMPIINAKVVHIDDFPAPIPEGFNPIIKRDYNIRTRNFFKQIWWKDMTKIAYRQNILYTGFLIGEYNDSVDKLNIGTFYKIHMSDLGYFGRNLYKNKGEIGIHGYNHMSLAIDDGIDFKKYGYRSWKNTENMTFGLKNLKDMMVDIYGDRINIYSYVPPSNLLTYQGKEALVESFPNLKTISGLYNGEKEKGLLLQEVGRDPDFNQLYSIPRFSSGFFYTPETMWSIYNGIASYGLLSHFFHPDDILDKERGADQSWDELKKAYEKIFRDVNKNFPELNPRTQTDATKCYMAIEDIGIDYQKIDDKIKVNLKNYKAPVKTFIRIRKNKIRSISNGEFYLIDSNNDYRLYFVLFNGPDIEVLLGGSL